eukprot:Gregarina_sp_Pseudo_9__5297@NODE_614_length_2486_cov_132_144258_g580_i0_p1_GENE_NODE_614_length_2486_cov_132_144258_g580_i0NODE_614_length_2486_cov_132_144258_g580_i0_p1_ORF_typecomplete_len613_score98_68COesterase/PF00135_28/3_3e82Abhydrolase_3/PF07859_13/1_5e14Chlorophyllase2/PF12740_7/0_00066Say1_Mug180/PF10340_9/0_03_NODE_614_length_2486_cov_132_144258_g580_i01381976
MMKVDTTSLRIPAAHSLPTGSCQPEILTDSTTADSDFSLLRLLEGEALLASSPFLPAESPPSSALVSSSPGGAVQPSHSVISSHLTRSTTEGLVLGTFTADGSCCLWAGVPFGQVSPGPGRFKLAKPPPDHCAALLDCTTHRDAPVAVPLSFTHFHSLHESDDCLSLNIYVPVLQGPAASLYTASNGTGSHGLPVLVWIHGGAFASGTGAAYGGEYLATEGQMVVVTLNYRLGVFGFINLKSVFDFSDEFDYNVGLSDQVAALKWIRNNIHNFHGDPTCITIAGSAAGSASVAMHLTNEESLPNFHRAIMHSGSLSLCDDFEVSREKGLRFLSLLRKKTGKNSLPELKEYLFCTDSEVLQDLLTEPIEQSREHFPIGPFFGAPGLPPSRLAALACLPKDKSVLIGHNRDEANLWLVLANAGGLPLTKAAVDHVMQRVPDEGKRKEIAALYPRDMSGITTFATDVIFANTTRLLADCLAQRLIDNSSSTGVWRYRVDEPISILPQLGAVHGQELPRLWRIPGVLAMLGAGAPDPAAEPLSRRLRAAWSSFARFGSPGWECYGGTLGARLMIFESGAALASQPHLLAVSADRVILDHESAHKTRAWRGLELLVW